NALSDSPPVLAHYQVSQRKLDAMAEILDARTPGTVGEKFFVANMAPTALPIYIEAFFRVIYPQVPIIHKPTFSANSTPDRLLITIILIGFFITEVSGIGDKR